MLRRHHLRHLAPFTILILGLLFFLSLILVFHSSRLFEFALVVIMSVYYFLWGLIHHHREGSLHPRVALEYLLISFLGICLLSFIIYAT